MSSFVFLVPQYGLVWPQCGFILRLLFTRGFQRHIYIWCICNCKLASQKMIWKYFWQTFLLKWNWNKKLCHIYGKLMVRFFEWYCNIFMIFHYITEIFFKTSCKSYADLWKVKPSHTESCNKIECKVQFIKIV